MAKRCYLMLFVIMVMMISGVTSRKLLGSDHAEITNNAQATAPVAEQQADTLTEAAPGAAESATNDDQKNFIYGGMGGAAGMGGYMVVPILGGLGGYGVLGGYKGVGGGIGGMGGLGGGGIVKGGGIGGGIIPPHLP